MSASRSRDTSAVAGVVPQIVGRRRTVGPLLARCPGLRRLRREFRSRRRFWPWRRCRRPHSGRRGRRFRPVLGLRLGGAIGLEGRDPRPGSTRSWLTCSARPVLRSALWRCRTGRPPVGLRSGRAGYWLWSGECWRARRRLWPAARRGSRRLRPGIPGCGRGGCRYPTGASRTPERHAEAFGVGEGVGPFVEFDVGLGAIPQRRRPG